MNKHRILSVATCALFLAMAFFAFEQPELIGNEGVYLVKSKQIAHPDFLETDWSFGEKTIRTHGLLYSAIVAPLWYTGLDALDVALLLRALQTAVFLLGIAALLRSIGLPLAPGLIGLSIWVIAGQAGWAGEWVLGAAEQKPVAYAAVLFALAAAIDSRWYRMAIFLSIATWFHILVGGWAALCLFGALLVRRSTIAPRRFLAAGTVAALLALPALVMGVVEMREATGYPALPIPPYDSIADLAVRFRTVHHLDPDFFTTPWKVTHFALALLGLLVALRQIDAKPQVRLILPTFVILAVSVAALGFIAFYTGNFWFLTLYPFRVADGMVPLLAYLLMPYVLVSGIRHISARDWSATLPVAAVAIIGTILLVAARMHITQRPQITVAAWSDHLKTRQSSSKAQAYEWIRRNTARDDQFLAPPWWDDFRLSAERPTFVSMKSVPNNDSVWEWYRRLLLANNGQTFPETGFAIHSDMKRNFAAISRDTLDKMTRDYDLDFYVTERPRGDLHDRLAYSQGTIRIYELGEK